ncbi:MAG: dihydrodipicolinate synthase family protein [Fimbriimonas sp.]
MTRLGAGVYPAAVTPFDERGAIDVPGVARLLAWFASKGCNGAVLAGTNGEGPSLSAPEKRDLVRVAVPLADGFGLQIVLGIASNSLEETVWLCRQAYEAGCPAVLLMPPGYFREAPEAAIEAWFMQVLNRSPIGVLVYNFPKRTGITLTAELMQRLARHERMLGLKDSSGSRENVASYAEALRGLGKLLYVGDETLLSATLNAGWTGTISGAANVLPLWLSEIVSSWHTDPDAAQTKFELVLPAIEALRSVSQPAANKLLLREFGVLERNSVRLPLLPMDQVPESLEVVRRLAS